MLNSEYMKFDEFELNICRLKVKHVNLIFKIGSYKPNSLCNFLSMI